ncbi:MAG: hypothetical protein GY896_21020 [Gammaproteobacteria bacterium]|nr:hypothetical protein [Gammaproteobacteria bacterium]
MHSNRKRNSITSTIKTTLLAATLALYSGAFLVTTHAAGMSPKAAIATAKEARKQAKSVG